MKTTIFRMDKQWGIYTTGVYFQSPGMDHHGKEFKRVHTHTHTHRHITELLCCTAEIGQHCKSTKL